MINSIAAKIAITLIPGVGDITIKKLIAYCGSFEEVFKTKKSHLVKIPGISDTVASNIIQAAKDVNLWKRVENEIAFCEKYNIRLLSFTDAEYPYRLLHCEDGPSIIFCLGNFDTNPRYSLSIVGTRKATNYGKSFCEKIINDFKEDGLNVTIISGLAFGIDITAHKSAIENNLPTIAVLAHGLDRIYPPEHKKDVKKILENGGLITEFLSETKPDKPNFVKRNRIIAAMSDATLVVESKKDGGAMITANYAFEYNRDVLALPGKITDKLSEGPNYLIKSNKAFLVESSNDIYKALGWQVNENKSKEKNLPIFFELTEEEKTIVSILKENGDTPIDLIALKASMPISKVSVLLLNLEFNGIVKTLPGKVFSLNIKI